MPTSHIGIGIVGGGFAATFHARSWQGVRHGDIAAVCSTHESSGRALRDLCVGLNIGSPAVYTSLSKMAQDPNVDAVWVTVPNYARVPVVEAIVEQVKARRSKVRAIAIEKPLARNVGEAKQIVDLVESAGLLHGYLENQVFAPAVTRGKEIIWRRGAELAGPPYLARAAEEHGGPHKPWFWRGALQGGGVLSDMMCHAIEACRFLLTPLDRSDSLRPVAITATTACLKWNRPRYVEQLRRQYGGDVDYSRAPAEDYASAEVVFETAEGDLVIGQANTSWSFSGAGLRLTFELLGPEYSLLINTLEPESKVFFSRNISGPAGEDLVEKQAAEQGQMPYLGDEALVYGYTDENRHMVDAFARGAMPRETLRDGLLVTRLLMAAYKSAELGCTIKFPPDGLDDFVPLVATEQWDPRLLARRAR